MKTTVAEWIKFITSDWGDVYLDDEVIIVDGEELPSEITTNAEAFANFSPSATVKIVCGIIHKNDPDGPYGDAVELKTFFRRWKKSQTNFFLVVDVEKTREAEFLELMKTHNFKVK